MHTSVRKYVIHTVYLLCVSTTHVVIFKEVNYKDQIYRKITETAEPNHR